MKAFSRRWMAMLAALWLAPSALAQITSTGPFIGAEEEGFEGPQVIFLPCIPARVFNNKGDLCTPGGSGCHTTTGWSYVCTIYAFADTWFYGSAGGATEITFDQPASRFGGWFGTNCGQPDASFSFYDVNGLLLNSVVGTVPADCQWYWLGWQASGSQGIKRVVIASNGPGGAFLDMDDLQADFAPIAPTVYCTGKVNSLGCTPAIAFAGAPDYAGATPFSVSVTNVLGVQPGCLFYSLSAATALPFKGGTLCCAQPLRRTPVQMSGGNLNTCLGSYQFDFNAYCVSGTNPALAPGNTVWAQYWAVDPGFPMPNRASLSNALRFDI